MEIRGDGFTNNKVFNRIWIKSPLYGVNDNFYLILPNKSQTLGEFAYLGFIRKV